MKVVYVYVAVIFGGAFLAIVYLRSQDRGWPSTIAFICLLMAVSLYQARRATRKQGPDFESAGNSKEA